MNNTFYLWCTYSTSIWTFPTYNLLMIDLFYLWLTYSTYDSTYDWLILLYDLLIRLSINLSYLWLTSSTYDLLMIYLSIWALIYPTYDSLILLRTVVGTGIFRSGFVLFIDNALPSTCPQGYRPCPRRACTARQILRAGSKIAVDDVLKASANDLHFLVGMHQPARNN